MGGGGLIGFTPLPGGYQTGNVEADLQTQLNAVLSFNRQWASYLPELNGASTPAAAAKVYVDDFERAGMPEATRARDRGDRECGEAMCRAWWNPDKTGHHVVIDMPREKSHEAGRLRPEKSEPAPGRGPALLDLILGDGGWDATRSSP